MVWPVVAILLVGLFIIIGIVMMMIPEEKIEFVFSQNTGRWQTSHGTKAEPVGDFIRLTRLEGDMYVTIPAMNVDADWYDVAEIESSVPIAYDTGYLLFTSPYNQRFDFNFRYDYDSGSAGNINKKYIYLNSHSAWQGIVRDIMIIPASGSQQAFIKSVIFIHANPWTKTKAWWSGFTRYYDPRLGSCFSMASPLFVREAFNIMVSPVFWVSIILLLGFSVVFNVIDFDQRIKKTMILIFICLLVILWGILDLRNNAYYLKAIGRDASVYWGKSLQEKREIINGNPDFIRFMRFCDEVIPANGRIFNYVANEIPGTPKDAMHVTQFYFNLRTRLNTLGTINPKIMPHQFYVLYGIEQKEIDGVDQEFRGNGSYRLLKPGGILQQAIDLRHSFEDISQLVLAVKKEGINKTDLSVAFYDDNEKTRLGTGEMIESVKGEVRIKVNPEIKYRGSRIYLRLENKSNEPIELESGRDKSRIAFRLLFAAKNLKPFKKYHERAYILTR